MGITFLLGLNYDFVQCVKVCVPLTWDYDIVHICSPFEPFLTMGFYNEIAIDLFETLSPPSVGNVNTLKDALMKLDPVICTSGTSSLMFS